jgi:hypothetical protein
MRMGATTISLKDIVKNFDNFTEENMGSLYTWNMEFNPKEEIKGDFAVKAKGSSTLVTKEVRMQALNQFTTTLTPEDWDYVPRYEMLKEKAKANDLPITIRTEEEAEKFRQSRVDKMAIELQYKAAQAQIDKDNAMALHMMTKARGENINSLNAMKGVEKDVKEPEVETKEETSGGMSGTGESGSQMENSQATI